MNYYHCHILIESRNHRIASFGLHSDRRAGTTMSYLRAMLKPSKKEFCPVYANDLGKSRHDQ